jgi:outer membrane protein assembly factor BamD (BamD/ComL family)
VKKTIFVLGILALVIAALAGGTAFLLRQKHLSEMGRIASQAEDKLKSKSYDQAISMLRRVEADGGTDRSTYLLGRAFTEQGKLVDAERYFDSLLKKYPGSPLVPDARLELAKFRYDEKNYDGAQAQLLQILANAPKSPAADHALVMLAKLSLQKKDEQQARKNLEIVLRKKDSPAKSEAEFVIGDLNMKRLKSPEAAPGDEVYTIQRGDTLSKMERKLKVQQDLLAGINDLDPLSLRVGQQIRVPHLDISLVIDKPNRTLTILNNGDFLKKYRVGLNHNDKELPAGNYSVIKKYPKGLDYVEGESRETIKAGAADNPYGSKFIELRRGVGIHGTDKEEKVGMLVSDGSVVMSNHDVEEVYALVKTKTPVVVKGSVNSDADTGK